MLIPFTESDKPITTAHPYLSLSCIAKLDSYDAVYLRIHKQFRL